jgi:hypothetical protein
MNNRLEDLMYKVSRGPLKEPDYALPIILPAGDLTLARDECAKLVGKTIIGVESFSLPSQSGDIKLSLLLKDKNYDNI